MQAKYEQKLLGGLVIRLPAIKSYPQGLPFTPALTAGAAVGFGVGLATIAGLSVGTTVGLGATVGFLVAVGTFVGASVAVGGIVACVAIVGLLATPCTASVCE